MSTCRSGVARAKSVGAWLRHGWPVIAAYVLSFLIMLGLWGWRPHGPHREERQGPMPRLTSGVITGIGGHGIVKQVCAHWAVWLDYQ